MNLGTNSNFCPTHHQLIGFITEMASAYCAVRTGSLNETYHASFLEGYICCIPANISNKSQKKFTPFVVQLLFYLHTKIHSHSYIACSAIDIKAKVKQQFRRAHNLFYIPQQDCLNTVFIFTQEP